MIQVSPFCVPHAKIFNINDKGLLLFIIMNYSIIFYTLRL